MFLSRRALVCIQLATYSQGRIEQPAAVRVRGKTVPIQTGNRTTTGKRTTQKASSLAEAGRIHAPATVSVTEGLSMTSVSELRNIWTDTSTGNFTEPQLYVVQTVTRWSIAAS